MKYTPIYLIAGSLLLAVVGYSAAAWYAGEQVEAALGEQSQALQDVFPLVKLGDRQYDRGLFSSEETVTITLATRPLGKPLHFTLTSKIRHLPFRGMLDLDAATIDSQISVNEDSRKEVSEWVGDKFPVAIHTVLHFGGAGKTLVTIAPVNTSRLSSGEASLAINFGEKLATYSMKGDFTNIEIKDKAISLVQASGLHFDDDHSASSPMNRACTQARPIFPWTSSHSVSRNSPTCSSSTRSRQIRQQASTKAADWSVFPANST